MKKLFITKEDEGKILIEKSNNRINDLPIQ